MHRRLQGFTLIEVIAALAIAALICMAAASAGSAALFQCRSAEAWSDVRFELQGAVARQFAGGRGEDGAWTGPVISNNWCSVQAWKPAAEGGPDLEWRSFGVRPPELPDRHAGLYLPIAAGSVTRSAGAGDETENSAPAAVPTDAASP